MTTFTKVTIGAALALTGLVAWFGTYVFFKVMDAKDERNTYLTYCECLYKTSDLRGMDKQLVRSQDGKISVDMEIRLGCPKRFEKETGEKIKPAVANVLLNAIQNLKVNHGHLNCHALPPYGDGAATITADELWDRVAPMPED